MATTTHDRPTSDDRPGGAPPATEGRTGEARPAGAPPAPGPPGAGRRKGFWRTWRDLHRERREGPVTLAERWRQVRGVLLAVALGLPVGAVVHRFSGELEVDRRFWTSFAVGTVGCALLAFCFPRWRRYPSRPGRPGDWPRTPVQKVLCGVLLLVVLVFVVTIGYYRLAD